MTARTSESEDSPDSGAEKQNGRINTRDRRGIKLPATIELSSARCNARGTEFP